MNLYRPLDLNGSNFENTSRQNEQRLFNKLKNTQIKSNQLYLYSTSYNMQPKVHHKARLKQTKEVKTGIDNNEWNFAS